MFAKLNGYRDSNACQIEENRKIKTNIVYQFTFMKQEYKMRYYKEIINKLETKYMKFAV